MTAPLLLDKHGFLQHFDQWNEDVANTLAHSIALELTEAHFEIIAVLREFYRENTHIPTNRVLAKIIKQALGADKASSQYLHQLFPDQVLRKLCLVAGLPKPKHCL